MKFLALFLTTAVAALLAGTAGAADPAPTFSGCGKFVKDSPTDGTDVASDQANPDMKEAEIENAFLNAASAERQPDDREPHRRGPAAGAVDHLQRQLRRHRRPADLRARVPGLHRQRGLRVRPPGGAAEHHALRLRRPDHRRAVPRRARRRAGRDPAGGRRQARHDAQGHHRRGAGGPLDGRPRRDHPVADARPELLARHRRPRQRDGRPVRRRRHRRPARARPPRPRRRPRPPSPPARCRSSSPPRASRRPRRARPSRSSSRAPRRSPPSASASRRARRSTAPASWPSSAAPARSRSSSPRRSRRAPTPSTSPGPTAGAPAASARSS